MAIYDCFQFFNEEQTPTQTQGAFRIDEERLNNMDDKEWLLLKNEGALPLIYGQLLSMGNLKVLLSNLQAKYNYAAEVETLTDALDFSLGDDEDNLTFDEL